MNLVATNIPQQVNHIKPVLIFNNELTHSQKESIRFEVFLDGQKGQGLSTYWHFIEFLESYGISLDSFMAARIEAGFDVVTPDGVICFNRVSPTDEEIEELITTPSVTVYQISDAELKLEQKGNAKNGKKNSW